MNKRHIGSSVGFTAPELLVLDSNAFHNHRNSFSVDVYAAGMCVLCFLVKCSTYLLDANHCYRYRYNESVEVSRQVSRQVITARIEKEWSIEEIAELDKLGLRQLVYMCVEQNPTKRISITEALTLLLKSTTVQ